MNNQENNNWQLLLSALAAGVIVTDNDGKIIYLNEEAEKIFGRVSADLLDETFTYPYAHNNSQEMIIIRPDGNIINADMVVKKGIWEHKPAHIITLHDITDRKQSESELQLASTVFSHAREGIIITDAKGTILEVNKAFSTITGYSYHEVLGQNPRLLKSNRNSQSFYKNLWQQLTSQGFWRGEIWNLKKNSEEYAELLTITAVCDENNKTTHYIGLFSDITAQKNQEKHLEFIAYHDPLTQLPNRLMFTDRLQQAMKQESRRGNKLVVIYLDLDGFKTINDQYGHEVGDQVLIKTSQRMRKELRGGDTIARIGGDEFAAVLIDVSTESDCIPSLQRLLQATSSPIIIDGISHQTSASIGVSIYPQSEPIDAEQLLRQADQAMYQAKMFGRNRFCFYDLQKDKILKGQYEKIKSIQEGLLNDEFVMFYQPKVNMRTGVVYGVEALIRWNHPEQGILSPDKFLPFIENDPLIVDLGLKVIDMVFAQLLQWHKTGLFLIASINISALHLLQDDFIEKFLEKLNMFPELDGKYIELEILETSALEDIAKVIKIIKTLEKYKITFSLDDFGTGYSSLSYLKKLPVQTIKIDRSFVQDILIDSDDLSIMLGILNLSSTFNLEVIAEGVESIEHGQLLLQLGCELAQGYCIAKPMPATEVSKWYTNWKASPIWEKTKPIKQKYYPLLFASVEHRKWVSQLCLNVKNKIENPSLPSIEECSFSKWLNSKELLKIEAEKNIAKIQKLHLQIHEKGNKITTMLINKDFNQAELELPAVTSLQNEIIIITQQIYDNQYDEE